MPVFNLIGASEILLIETHSQDQYIKPNNEIMLQSDDPIHEIYEIHVIEHKIREFK